MLCLLPQVGEGAPELSELRELRVDAVEPRIEQVADVTAWLKSKGLVSRDIPYGDMVDSSFLPR